MQMDLVWLILSSVGGDMLIHPDICFNLLESTEQ